MATFPTPLNKFAGFLQERNLTLEQNQLLQLTPLTFDEIKQILGYTPALPTTTGVGIPYFNTDGSYLEVNGVPFVRVRRDGWVGDGKYLQSKKSGAHAYLPQVQGIDWKAISLDFNTPICITEGEFKAIANTLRGVPTVGLGGVSSLCKRGTHDLVDPLDQFVINGRTIYLVFDADAKPNPHVESALHRSASILYSLGAKPLVLRLKTTPGVKLGLDDYLNRGGSWEKLLETQEEPIHDADLAILNTNYCVGTAGPYVVRLADGHRFKINDFRALEQNRRRKTERGFKLVADDFLQQRTRPEYDREVFDPRIEWGFHPDRRVFNRWRGLAVGGVVGGAADGWDTFLSKLCGTHKDYVEKWLAHMLQRPWERTNVSLMCVSPVQGIGKSLLGAIMLAIIGRAHSISTSLERVSARFNSELEGKILVVIEEAEGLFKNLEGFIKDFITNPTVTVEHKGINPYVVDNYARVILNSNNPLPLRMSGFERRWLVWMPEITHEEARGEWGQWVRTWAEKVMSSEEELGKIRHRLENLSLEGWDPTAPAPVTQEMLDIAEGSTKGVDIEAENIYEALAAAGGRTITTKEITQIVGRKTLASFKAYLKAMGGGSAQLLWKEEGIVKRGTVWWVKGREFKTKRDGSGNLVVDEPIGREDKVQMLTGAAGIFGRKW